MPDNVPGYSDIQETEENQLWASGPDNQHKRFHMKAKIKSTTTDTGNTGFTTTLRGGFPIALKDSDGLGYAYDADATDGTQAIVGLVEKHMTMLDRSGTAADRFTKLLTAGIIRNIDELIGVDKSQMAVLLRIGFTLAQLEPHGSAFGFHPRKRYFKSGDYTLLDADHGCMFVAKAAANFTLPSLATVGRGYQVLLYNGVDADMVVTGAANTIQVGDAAGAVSTTITFNTANEKMGGQALMYSDYISDGGALGWYVLFTSRTYTTA